MRFAEPVFVLRGMFHGEQVPRMSGDGVTFARRDAFHRLEQVQDVVMILGGRSLSKGLHAYRVQSIDHAVDGGEHGRIPILLVVGGFRGKPEASCFR